MKLVDIHFSKIACSIEYVYVIIGIICLWFFILSFSFFNHKFVSFFYILLKLVDLCICAYFAKKKLY